VRARRRYDEILGKGLTADFDAIFEDVKRRYERDMGRADSPLKPADDAHLLYTSEMSIEAAFQAAQSIIDAVLSRNA
ncbi:(d)CMP kinase, partial [Rhizobium ruizarguesonis]